MTNKTNQKREAAKAKVDALQQQLADQVETLADTDQWKAYLAFAAKFHTYSWGNQLLILAQRPDATQVAGYRKWQEMGRQVRKGEHGIKILAPRTGKCRDCDGTGGPDGLTCGRCHGSGRYLYFTTASVFDVSQTDGDELPDNPAVPELLQGEDEAGWYDRIAALLPDGWALELGDTESDANGWTRHDTRQVRIAETLSPAARVKTLVHELAHVKLHGPQVNYAAERGRCECEAESVAYVVLGALGIDSQDYSLGYVAGWTAGDADKVRATASAVTGAAREILDGLFATDDADAEVAVAA